MRRGICLTTARRSGMKILLGSGEALHSRPVCSVCAHQRRATHAVVRGVAVALPYHLVVPVIDFSFLLEKFWSQRPSWWPGWSRS
jgi:hypothetical protein